MCICVQWFLDYNQIKMDPYRCHWKDSLSENLFPISKKLKSKFNEWLFSDWKNSFQAVQLNRGWCFSNHIENDRCLGKTTSEIFFIQTISAFVVSKIIMNFLDPIAKNVLPSQNRSYQIPMNNQQFEILLRSIVHVSSKYFQFK
jgi:hypothetical protein